MPNQNAARLVYDASFRRLGLLASIVFLVFIVGGILWMATASVGGAVIASGTVIVESSAREIKHTEGGYVDQILVKEGDEVDAGQVLVRLNATRIDAELSILADQLNSAVTTEAKLLAEISGSTDVEIAREDAAHITQGEKFERLLESQRLLLTSTKESVTSQMNQLREQSAQTREEIVGLEAQLAATNRELVLLRSELKNLESLLERGFSSETPVNRLRRDVVQVEGRRGSLLSAIARGRLSISEREIQLLRVGDEVRRSALESLATVRQEKLRLIQIKSASDDRRQRLDIRTAHGGVVHDLQIYTVDGVVRAGEVLMSIIPREDNRVIEARVDITDIDQVYVGQAASLLFSSFNMRTTPQVDGQVVRVSPDATIDNATGKAYYRVRIQLNADQRQKLGDKPIVAGMPVDAFLFTDERTVASYLIQPVADHMRRAFREE